MDPGYELGCSCVLYFLLVVIVATPSEGLQCYSCPLASRSSLQSANLHCLVNGTETTCQPYQDRCYSYVRGEGGVEKGCTMAESCIGNRICCQTDFCNAGYGADLKTGYGQPCEGETNCVLDDGMVCRRETTEVNQLSRCLCEDEWFPLGGACLPQSGEGGLCFQDNHCRLVNAFCQFQTCRCSADFFPNDTLASCQLKFPILAACSDTVQCRARNSVCQGRCVCDLGYLYDDFSGHCSGSAGHFPILTLTWMVTLTLTSVLPAAI